MFLKKLEKIIQGKLLFLFLFINQISLSEGFLAGTLVKIPSGYKQIDKLKENDLVATYNFQDNNLEYEKINAIQIRHYKTRIKLTIKDKEIITAPDHKFYCPFSGKGNWIEAKDLKPNDFLLSNFNEFIRINNVTYIAQETDFFCLSIDKHHNYLISENNILVHNTAILIPIFEAIIAAGLKVFGNYGTIRVIASSLSLGELARRMNRYGWTLWDTPVKLPDDNKINHIFGKENGAGKKHGFIGGPNDEDPEKWWQKITKRVKDAYLREEIKEDGQNFEISESQNINPNFGDLIIRGIILKGVIHISTAFLKKR